jgi:hypothetical protein
MTEADERKGSPHEAEPPRSFGRNGCIATSSAEISGSGPERTDARVAE